MASSSSVIREDSLKIAAAMGESLAPLAGRTLLVTGAGGFLCSYLLDLVAAVNDTGERTPIRVIGLDNFLTSLPERVAHLQGRPDVTFVRHDLRHPYDPQEPVDWIVHGASVASPTFYRRFPMETIDVNVNGTRQMLDLVQRGGRGLVVISTSEIYGDPEPSAIPTAEDYRGNVSCTGPRACYDESKRLAETLCWVYHHLRGTPVKTVRPFNVYGPGQRIDDARIIPDLMSAALERRPIVLLSDGRATRSFCYVADFIRGLLYVLLSGAHGQAFNVGNDEEISIGDLALRMRDVTGPPSLPIEFRQSADPNYLIDSPQRRCPDLSKIRALAPWRPEVRLTEGLARTLRSYRELAGQTAPVGEVG